jgi:tetratricopeptide (TPR) repeat protein
MARALADKTGSKHISEKNSDAAKKSRPQKASETTTHGKATLKGKMSPAGTNLSKTAEKNKKSAAPARKPAKKERTAMEVESRIVATGVAPSAESSSRLLRQTKATSAALALLEKGIEHLYKKDFKKARTEFKTLLETYPGEPDILARTRSYLQICIREEAMQKKASVSTDQLYTLGVLEHNKADYDKAISYFLQSLESHPDADYIHYSIAASLAMKGDAEGAIRKLRKAIELNEDSRVHAKNDADFSSLAGLKHFQELVGIDQSMEINRQ